MKITMTPETEAEKKQLQPSEWSGITNVCLVGPNQLHRINFGCGEAHNVAAFVQAEINANVFLQAMTQQQELQRIKQDLQRNGPKGIFRG